MDSKLMIQETQRKLYCNSVQFGSYECYEYTMVGATVDRCLVGEINKLNINGITTIGCCCGHGKQLGYIQVIPEHISKMVDLGYEQLPVDKNGNGKYCFKPKTILYSMVDCERNYKKEEK